MGQAGHAERILIIDDNKEFADTLASQLEELGRQAHAVYGGREGVEEYGRGGYALVITDLSMPGMDGMEVLDALLSRDPRASVLMVTGYGTIEKAVTAIKAGAIDFIPKPFRIGELDVIIRRALARQEVERQFGIFRGLAWGLAISIPFWIGLGYVLYRMLAK